MERSATQNYFHHSIVGLLGLGNVLCFLFTIDISWLSNWNPITMAVLGVTVLLNCFNVFMIYKKKPEERDVVFSSLISASFIGSITGVALGLYTAGNPSGSFFYILIMVMAITEVNFVFDKRFAIALYLVSAGYLLYAIFGLGIEFPSGFRAAFGFALLFMWKTLNQVFHRKFALGKESRIKLDTFHSTVNTLQNELNNTTHVIMGFSQLMQANQDEEKKQEYLVRINNGLDKMSTQIKKIRELEDIVVDESYEGQNFIRIK